MFDFLPFLLAFVVALFLGIYLGRILFSAKFQSEKVSLEERFKCQYQSIPIAERAI
jgi:DNA recombination protein RmuC